MLRPSKLIHQPGWRSTQSIKFIIFIEIVYSLLKIIPLPYKNTRILPTRPEGPISTWPFSLISPGATTGNRCDNREPCLPSPWSPEGRRVFPGFLLLPSPRRREGRRTCPLDFRHENRSRGLVLLFHRPPKRWGTQGHCPADAGRGLAGGSHRAGNPVV